MKTKKNWYGRPIILNEDKFFHQNYKEDKEEGVIILNKKNHQIIFKVENPEIIKQINDNEFIIISQGKDIANRKFIFKHIHYNKENNIINTLYEKEYEAKNYRGSFDILDNTIVMNSFLKTTIYNAKTRKSLTLKYLDRVSIKQDEYCNKYLQGKIEIENEDELKDYLTIAIDINTLEFNGFYSQQQDRFISIIEKDKNDFMTNFNITIKKEVLKYLDLLSIQKEIYQEESNRKAEEIVRKKLIKQKN